jgi:hypothetical protein
LRVEKQQLKPLSLTFCAGFNGKNKSEHLFCFLLLLFGAQLSQQQTTNNKQQTTNNKQQTKGPLRRSKQGRVEYAF